MMYSYLIKRMIIIIIYEKTGGEWEVNLILYVLS